MPVEIANVELSYSFDQWRVTTNQVINTLREDVVLREELEANSLNPFPELVQATSLDSVEAEAEPITSSPIDTVELTDITKTKHFKAGQKVRIYGARLSNSSAAIISSPPAAFATKTGFTGFTGGSTFSYRLAQFEYSTGKVSASSPIVSVTNVDALNFNDVNNINLQITRTNTNYGVLVYRRVIGQTDSVNYNLIAVLGPKELTGTVSNWVDYYNYDYVTWSKKNFRNEFISTSGLIHFDLTAPTATKLGWTNAEVKLVDTTLNRITFTNDYYFENTCIVAHDDTLAVQSSIDSRYASGAKSLSLGTKTYFVQGLTIPNNFALLGNGTKTGLRKLSWSSNFTTGNKILKSDGSINDFNLTDLVVDGNMQNQYMVSEFSDPDANYLIDVIGNIFRYENIKVINAIGGGINAVDSTSVSMVSSFILDGNLNDRNSYSPLNVSSSSEVILTSNIFRNYPGPVDASVVTTGSIVGNIIKNCGSGLVVYGSTNLASSPNILMGPANEFLPTPDILNSVYDSVNITLEPNINYNSDTYTYQENGELFDLTVNRAALSHRIDKLQKIDSVESLYDGEVLINNTSPIQTILGTALANGEFRFSINAASVNVLTNNYSYSTLKAINNNHIGLVYRSILTEYVPSGNINPIYTPVINNISRSISANTIGVNSSNNVLNIANANTYFDLGDEVYYTVPATNTAVTGLTSNTVYYISYVNSSSVALSSSFGGSNIDLNETRITNPAESHSLKKTLYTIKIENVSNISVGTKVKLLSHGGTPSLNNPVGTVKDYSPNSTICTIIYSPTINISSAGSGGNITVENSFVLAKGRIL